MKPTLGIFIGPIIAALVLAALVWTARRMRRWRDGMEPDAYDFALSRGFEVTAYVAMFITVVIALIAVFPFQMRYHAYREVSGQVQSVDERRLDGVYLVTIDGRPYRVDDTRAAGLRPGNGVDLLCIDVWQYAGTPGTVCNWVSKWPPSGEREGS